MTRPLVLAVLGLAALVAAGAMLLGNSDADVRTTQAFTAPGLEPLTPADAQTEFWRLTPALLLVVYAAFGETEEGTIYDTLATVTHGEALEYLYLQRVGAMAGGGLEEADQTIHEIKLLATHMRRNDAAMVIDASWQVIGTVGHTEHMHVRGNTYSAALAVAPVNGAWRITKFELLDVNRTAAGEVFAAPQTN